MLGRSATCSMAVLVLDIDGDIDGTQEQDRVGTWEGRLIELQEFVNCKPRQNRTAAPIPPALTKKKEFVVSYRSMKRYCRQEQGKKSV